MLKSSGKLGAGSLTFSDWDARMLEDDIQNVPQGINPRQMAPRLKWEGAGLKLRFDAAKKDKVVGVKLGFNPLKKESKEEKTQIEIVHTSALVNWLRDERLEQDAAFEVPEIQILDRNAALTPGSQVTVRVIKQDGKQKVASTETFQIYSCEEVGNALFHWRERLRIAKDQQTTEKASVVAGAASCDPATVVEACRSQGEEGKARLEKFVENLVAENTVKTLYQQYKDDPELGRVIRSAAYMWVGFRTLDDSAQNTLNTGKGDMNAWEAAIKTVANSCGQCDWLRGLPDEEKLDIVGLVKEARQSRESLVKIVKTTRLTADDLKAVPYGILGWLLEHKELTNHHKTIAAAFSLRGRESSKFITYSDEKKRSICDPNIPPESCLPLNEADHAHQVRFAALPLNKAEGEGNLFNTPGFIDMAQPIYRDTEVPRTTAVSAQKQHCFPGNRIQIAGRYLALQSPHEGNVENFFKVLVEHQAKVSISLLNDADYDRLNHVKIIDPYPLEGEVTQFGGIKVQSLKSESLLDGHLEVHYLLINDNFFHRRFCYRNWPDHGAASAADMVWLGLLLLELNVHPENPVAVNCLAGVGRTGTLIAVMEMIKQLQRSGFGCSASVQSQFKTLEELISQLRMQRGSQTVQKPVQYQSLAIAEKHLETLLMVYGEHVKETARIL